MLRRIKITSAVARLAVALAVSMASLTGGALAVEPTQTLAQGRAHALLPPTPTPPDGGAPVPVRSSTCATRCQTAHDMCRVKRKGSPSCDTERQVCLQDCLQKKGR